MEQRGDHQGRGGESPDAQDEDDRSSQRGGMKGWPKFHIRLLNVEFLTWTSSRRASAVRARRVRRRQPGGRVGQHFAVPDAERLDPSLLSQGQPNEEAKLDQLGVREMLAQFRPQRRIGDLGIPDDGARVRQCHLLALSELKGIREV